MGSSASDPLYVDVTYIGKGGVGEEYVTIMLCYVMIKSQTQLESFWLMDES